MLHDKKRPSLKDKHLAQVEQDSAENQVDEQSAEPRRRGRPSGKVKLTINNINHD
jgi:hypothetical protein